MRERLRSYLDKSKGFTLVELLVVIAIIAILVLLVIIALDPLERIRDANDRNAQSSARALGSAVASCITKELGKNSATVWGDCSTQAFLLAGYIQNVNSIPAGTTFANSSAENICVTVLNPGGHGPGNAVTFNTNDSSISDPEAGAGVCN